MPNLTCPPVVAPLVLLLAACAPQVTVTSRAPEPKPQAVQIQRLAGAFTIRENNRSVSFECGGADVTVQGNANTVRLFGTCGEVTVRGNTNTVFVGRAARLILMGNNNRVTLETTPRAADVADRGNNNRVTVSRWD